MTEPMKRRGRPKGSKNTRPAKPRFTRKPETPPKSASPADIHEMIEDMIEAESVELQAAGNGRAYEPPPVEPPQPAPGPALTKLFVAAVENGYVIRPAYTERYKGETDDRSWVVSSREELARMMSWLMAERGSTSPDFLGGPYHMPQPVDPHYAPPIGLKADETAS